MLVIAIGNLLSSSLAFFMHLLLLSKFSGSTNETDDAHKDEDEEDNDHHDVVLCHKLQLAR